MRQTALGAALCAPYDCKDVLIRWAGACSAACLALVRMMHAILYWLIWPLAHFLIRWMFDFDYVRHAELPPGPKVIVANHPTTIDPFIIAVSLAEPIHILITEPVFRAPLLGRYLRSAGHIPVELAEGRSAYNRALRLLQRGRTILVFPEGCLSPDEGGTNPARTGAARLALAAGVPIVPVGIYIARERTLIIQNNRMEARGRGKFVLDGPYKATQGKPLYVEGDIEDREVVKELSTWIMLRINSLVRESEQRVQALMPALKAGQ